jgi:hypothetical protein
MDAVSPQLGQPVAQLDPSLELRHRDSRVETLPDANSSYQGMFIGFILLSRLCRSRTFDCRTGQHFASKVSSTAFCHHSGLHSALSASNSSETLPKLAFELLRSFPCLQRAGFVVGLSRFLAKKGQMSRKQILSDEVIMNVAGEVLGLRSNFVG